MDGDRVAAQLALLQHDLLLGGRWQAAACLTSGLSPASMGKPMAGKMLRFTMIRQASDGPAVRSMPG
jgi:hypothetical protein